jgi:hypothetical protein
MKTTALLFSVLLLAACASQTAVIDKRTYKCDEPNLDVGIEGGYEDPRQSERIGERNFLIEVSNNSHAEITVTSVRVEPSQRNPVRYDPAFDGADVVIAEGDAHLFRMPARQGMTLDPPIDPSKMRNADFVEFFVTVELSNGDQYRCNFRAPLER